MTDVIESIKSWSALKWAALVLIAGFIGQFGRMAAEAIAKKITARRAKKEKTSGQDNIVEKPREINLDKAEKKRLKALAKAAKKANK